VLDSAGSRQGPRAAFVEDIKEPLSSKKQCNLQTTPATLNFTILTLYQGDIHRFEKFMWNRFNVYYGSKLTVPEIVTF